MPSGCLSTDVYLGQGPGVGPGPRWWDYKFWLARKNLQVLQEKPRGFLLRTRSARDTVVPETFANTTQFHTSRKPCKRRMYSLMQYSFLISAQMMHRKTDYLYLTYGPEKQEIRGYFSTTTG